MPDTDSHDAIMRSVGALTEALRLLDRHTVDAGDLAVNDFILFRSPVRPEPSVAYLSDTGTNGVTPCENDSGWRLCRVLEITPVTGPSSQIAVRTDQMEVRTFVCSPKFRVYRVGP